MKHYHFLYFFLLSLLFACTHSRKTEEQPPTTNPGAEAIPEFNVTDSKYISYQNTDFIKQMEEGDNYTVEATKSHSLVGSLCGHPDFKNIYEYNDEPIDVRNFVTKCSKPVGAISFTNIQNNIEKYCSGTLISENLFLTASHCVDSSIVGRYVAFNYQLISKDNPDTQVFFQITKIVETGYTKTLDYAILQLEGKPGLRFGYTKIDTSQLEPADSLIIIQHPDGRPKEIAAGHLSELTDLSLIYDDIDTERGSSGSGIINRKGELVGVHTNGGCDPFSTNGVNHGVSIRAVLFVSDTLRHLRQ